jgi:hypothetical protein
MSCIYTAVIENHFVAISAMLTGVVSREQLNRLDLQVI